MSKGINKVIIVGYLGDDPDVRYGQSGNAVTTISVATTDRWKDKNGEDQERTEWHRIKFFGKLAEIAGKYLGKGKQVYVEGKLQTTKYEKNGVDHYTTDIIAHEMQMLGKADGGGERNDKPRDSEQPRSNQQGRNAPASRGGASSRQAPARSQQNREPPQRNDDPFPDDDIPF